MDVYRNGNELIVWKKEQGHNIRVATKFKSYIYVEEQGEAHLKKHRIPYSAVTKLTYKREQKRVMKIEVPLSHYESMVKKIERLTDYRIKLYNADITPEQMYLYETNQTALQARPTCMDIDYQHPYVIANEKKLTLQEFETYFNAQDPDLIRMPHAFSQLPKLAQQLPKCPFHRWDPQPIKFKGGRSFFSYGFVRYKEFAVRLHGRILINTNDMIPQVTPLEGIMELCELSGTLPQHMCSRSFGAVFQGALVKKLIRKHMLVPHKEKPIDTPLNFSELLECDRGGHTLDPKVGFHRNVAEIDFTSMYPWIIHNKNVSAETIMTDEGPFETVPDTPIQISHKRKGLIPQTIKPFIDRRMYYKKHPTRLNKKKALGLKWVLVTSYGYLRFREFKLGIPRSHMAVCAYARDILLKAMHLAEESGFEVVHGIVDSLFIKKKNITETEVKSFCKKLEKEVGIPVSSDGIFKWVIFRPSITDSNRPVPATYFGAFHNGELKVRGIELRQKSTPFVVKYFQQKVLDALAQCTTKKEYKAQLLTHCRLLRKLIQRLPHMDAKWLATSITVAKTEYTNNIPQKIIVQRLQEKGIEVHPGTIVSFVYSKKGPVLQEEYEGADINEYRKRLVRSLYMLYQPVGITKETIEEYAQLVRQTKLTENWKDPLPVAIPQDYYSKEHLPPLIFSET